MKEGWFLKWVFSNLGLERERRREFKRGGEERKQKRERERKEKSQGQSCFLRTKLVGFRMF